MAFKVSDVDYRNIFELPIKTYNCTSYDDIAKLPRFKIPGTQVLNDGHDNIENAPCGYGSVAIIKGGGVYMLFADNEWATF